VRWADPAHECGHPGHVGDLSAQRRFNQPLLHQQLEGFGKDVGGSDRVLDGDDVFWERS
jgi:hypothetical protein